MKKNKKFSNIKNKILKKIKAVKRLKNLNSAHIYHETGRIIANPLIYKNYNYFDE